MFPTHWSKRMSFPGGFAVMVIFSPGMRTARAPPSAFVVPLLTTHSRSSGDFFSAALAAVQSAAIKMSRRVRWGRAVMV